MSNLIWGVNRSINKMAEAFAEAKKVRGERAIARRRRVGDGKWNAQWQRVLATVDRKAALRVFHAAEESWKALRLFIDFGVKLPAMKAERFAFDLQLFAEPEAEEFKIDLQLFGGRKITTRHEAEDAIADYISAETHPAYGVTNLRFTTSKRKGGDGRTFEVTTVGFCKDLVDWNRSSKDVKICSIAKARIGNAVKPVRRFSFSELHITVNAIGGAKPAEWLFKATFAYNVQKASWMLYALRDGKPYFACIDDGCMREVDEQAWGKHCKGALVYNDCSTITGSYASAGNLKAHKLVSPCMSEQGYNSLARSVRAMGGICLTYSSHECLKKAKDFAQANVRMAAPFTKSFNGPKIRVAAFFMGKWKLTDLVTGGAFDGADGFNPVNCRLYKRWLEGLGYDVENETAVMGIGAQIRPFSLKTASMSVGSNVIADMVIDEDGLCHNAPVVVLYASNITREQQEAFGQAVKSKGTEGEYAGKTVIVIYDDAVDFDPADPASYELIDIVGDLNAYKAEQDLTMGSYLQILKLFRKRRSAWVNGMGTSTQLLQSLFPACPRLNAYMRLGFRAQMNKAVADIRRCEARAVATEDVLAAIKKSGEVLRDEVSGVELTDAERSVLRNLDYGINVVSLAERLAPTFAWEKDAALFKDELKAACKAGKSRADRVRVPIDGTDQVLMPDPAALYGAPILGMSKESAGHYMCYSNLANGLGVEHAAGVKYPKTHIREASLIDFANELFVAMGLAGNKHAAEIASMYASASEAIMFVACTGFFMKQNAGCDFDSDEMFVAKVLTAEEYGRELAGIDWDAEDALEKYVKIQLAYHLGKMISLVVDIDPDAERKSASKASKKVAAATEGSDDLRPQPTVDLDSYWSGISLGKNMPTREEIEAGGALNAGNEASIRNLLNANLDVGIVTVIHLIFSHLYFELRRMRLKTDEELSADELTTVKVAKCILTKVFGNRNVAGQAYESLCYTAGANGVEVVKIDINEYDRIRESARVMELTRDNMMRFCYDMVANCRMGQEMTIDACKTLQVVENLDYAEDLRAYVKLLSRQEMDIVLKISAAGKSSVSIAYPTVGKDEDKRVIKDTKFMGSGDKEHVYVRDYTYEMKLQGYRAVAAAVKPLLSNKPGFDAELVSSISNLRSKYPENAELADFFKTVYMHLNTAQDQAIKIATEGIYDEKERALASFDVKAEHAGFFNGIGSAVRKGQAGLRHSLATQNPDLSEDEIAALQAASLISLNGSEDSKMSSFAYRVLPEEYMRFILAFACADDDRVARFTEDRLAWVDRKHCHAGDKLMFTKGHGANGEGRVVAEAKDKLEGEYTILEDGDRLFASTDVLNLMPLRDHGDVLVVETKLNEWMYSHMDAFLKEIAPNSKGEAARVQLWSHKTVGQDGDELRDTIAVKDEDGVYGIGYFHTMNGGPVYNLYNGVEGSVTNVTIHTTKKGDRIAILLLEDCKNIGETHRVEPVFEGLPVDEGWQPKKAGFAASKKPFHVPGKAAAPAKESSVSSTFRKVSQTAAPVVGESKKAARKVVVAGGRDFSNKEVAFRCLDKLVKSGDVIVSGHAQGADTLGEEYAAEHGLAVELHLADWKKNGKAAGPIRNAEMADVADMVIAFWDGKSPGTKSMIGEAKKRNLKVVVFDYNGKAAEKAGGFKSVKSVASVDIDALDKLILAEMANDDE